MSQSLSTVSPLPDIEQQFKDVGHALQSKKRERRKARQQQLLLENKVGYFEKQQRETSKSIEQQKRKLEYVMKVRQRQQEDRREVSATTQLQKELQNYLNQQQLNRLRMQSQFERKTHQQHMKEANDRLNNRNQYIYESIKGKIDRDVSRKKQNMKDELQARRDRFRDIERQKSNGRERVHSFRLEQTSQALNSYREKMHREETLRDSIQQNIEHLSSRQQDLMEKLKKSHMQHEKLQATLERAYDVELNLLESLVSQKPKSRTGRRSTSSGKNDGKDSPLGTVRRQFRPSLSPQVKFMNITLNTFVPRKEVNPEQMPSRRRAKSRLSEAIRHIEQQYKS